MTLPRVLVRGLAGLTGLVLGGHRRRLEAACAAPAAAQQALRAEVLTGLQATERGRAWRRWEEVPVVGYEALAAGLARERAGEVGVVTPGRVEVWERTSGTSAGAKLIPYTARSRRVFSDMFAVWLVDLLRHGPRFETGKSYFSISPDFSPQPPTAGGAPVGLADDRDYLGPGLRWLLSPFWVGPAGAASLHEPEAFLRAVCTALCAEADLEVISVWSPSFLGVLLGWMEAHAAELPRGDKVRDPAVLWPRLKLVSAWDQGWAAGQAGQLAARFPGVLFQGKGLLATEGPVTVPLVGVGQVPLLQLVVLELEREGGEVVPLHEAEAGEEGALLLSVPGGFARYRLGDRVAVGARWHEAPRLTLLGRPDVVDLVGEKLAEPFVREVLRGLGVEDASYVSLVGHGDHYVLALDRTDWPPEELAGRLDHALCAAHHYRHARSLGQLGPARVVLVPEAPRLTMEARRGAGRWAGAKHRLLRADAPELEAWL